jgi:hypothetical protein
MVGGGGSEAYIVRVKSGLRALHWSDMSTLRFFGQSAVIPASQSVSCR